MLNKKILISGKILAQTGLKIGGSTSAMSIGGIDSPVRLSKNLFYTFLYKNILVQNCIGIIFKKYYDINKS